MSLDRRRFITTVTAAGAAVGITSVSKAEAAQQSTAGETAAGVTVADSTYGPGDIRRYGASPTASTAVNTAAIQSAINVSARDATLVRIPAGNYHIDAGVLTIPAGGNVCIQGEGKFRSILYAPSAAPGRALLTINGTTNKRTEEFFIRDLMFWSANGNGTGLNCSWCIRAEFDGLYFYNLQYGWVGTQCFANSFKSNDAYQITADCYQFNVGCNNNTFLNTRMVGRNGINVTNTITTLNVIGCNIEGILAGGAGINIQPAPGTFVVGVTIQGTHFENIGIGGVAYAIRIAGSDPAAVRGVTVFGNYIFGGHKGYGHDGAVSAISLENLAGYDFRNNVFSDWQSMAFHTSGTDDYGEITNNMTTPTLAVPSLSGTAGFGSNCRVTNNLP